MTTALRRACRSKWTTRLVSLVMGCVFLGIQWANGHPGQGAASLAIMLAFGAVFLLGGRSETIRGLRGDGRDERFAQIDLRATAIAGHAVIGAVIIGFVVELARGHDGNPYAWLGAIAGLAYLVAVVVERLRS